jgi:hypothetical protein
LIPENCWKRKREHAMATSLPLVPLNILPLELELLSVPAHALFMFPVTCNAFCADKVRVLSAVLCQVALCGV